MADGHFNSGSLPFVIIFELEIITSWSGSDLNWKLTAYKLKELEL